MSAPLSCREFVEFLDDYLAGELDPAREAEFEAHLAVCPSCVIYLNTYRDAVRLGRAALESSDAPIPETIPEDLVRAILAAHTEES